MSKSDCVKFLKERTSFTCIYWTTVLIVFLASSIAKIAVKSNVSFCFNAIDSTHFAIVFAPKDYPATSFSYFSRQRLKCSISFDSDAESMIKLFLFCVNATF